MKTRNPFSTVSRVLVLKADKLYASALDQTARRLFPGASFQIVSLLKDAKSALARAPVDLFLTGVCCADGDVLELLSGAPVENRRFRRVLVVTNRREQLLLLYLRVLPIDGVFDSSSEGPEQFQRALRSISRGEPYWSPSVLERLRRDGLAENSFCRRLTPVEQLVLSAIGDGSDDSDAARRLGMKPSSVQSVRRSLHHKLGIQHKGQVVRLAAQYGFVHFTPEGVVRPGYSILLNACKSRLRPSSQDS